MHVRTGGVRRVRAAVGGPRPLWLRRSGRDTALRRWVHLVGLRPAAGTGGCNPYV